MLQDDVPGDRGGLEQCAEHDELPAVVQRAIERVQELAAVAREQQRQQGGRGKPGEREQAGAPAVLRLAPRRPDLAGEREEPGAPARLRGELHGARLASRAPRVDGGST